MAQLVTLISGVVLGGVAEVVGSNLARGKIFTASIGSVDSLYPSVYIYIYIYSNYELTLHVFFFNLILTMLNNVPTRFAEHKICLFDLIFYVPSTIFQLYRDGSSWVQPVLS